MIPSIYMKDNLDACDGSVPLIPVEADRTQSRRVAPLSPEICHTPIRSSELDLIGWFCELNLKRYSCRRIRGRYR
ncbi:hypothetical protein QVD17_31474 [Tagetes erecta]|uniref:Uncharacterized protein n=1 Tax=Tagetes erecta TaxID=13708 RepID=A0AAD8K3G2_TARER|nr:hypothetical protein QVD17_31474 [Tagetes erecta]